MRISRGMGDISQKKVPKMAGGGKMKKTMHEWKAGKLHSGSKTGPLVTSQKQAIAIGLNSERRK